MIKRSILALILLSLIAVTAYTLLWFSYKTEVERTIREGIITATKEGVTFTGKFLPVTGFPGPYQAAFSGAVSYNGDVIEVPYAEIKSFFLPRTPVSFSLPDGAAIEGTQEPKINNIDALYLTFLIPERLPADMTSQQIQAWRDSGGTLEISSFTLKKKSLNVTGNGHITLDDELQPEGTLSATITGGIAFLAWLKDENVIESKEAIIASAVMAGLSKENPETGERVISAKVSLQNGMMFLGPLRLLSVPRIVWPEAPRPYSEPALPQ